MWLDAGQSMAGHMHVHKFSGMPLGGSAVWQVDAGESLKEKGNKAYKEGKLERAAKLYDRVRRALGQLSLVGPMHTSALLANVC